MMFILFQYLITFIFFKRWLKKPCKPHSSSQMWKNQSLSAHSKLEAATWLLLLKPLTKRLFHWWLWPPQESTIQSSVGGAACQAHKQEPAWSPIVRKSHLQVTRQEGKHYKKMVLPLFKSLMTNSKVRCINCVWADFSGFHMGVTKRYWGYNLL